ncbi:hypothetical protein Hypma_008407 [Hypsizygus marmoreus]|uniref:Uncharacterized protein n=1 Tax=Hypsizygus marmoreus TaxID=39966 RepID=A0A369JQ12_HYPMA|nr:hypothetical protein Hypma_008407 [Hypsizygus marmoreus]
MTCRTGDALFAAGKYEEAKKSYWECALKVVGPNYRIPGVAGSEGGVRTNLYTTMSPYDRANLMGCCNGIAKCLLKEGDLEGALAWLDEVAVLYYNTYFTSEPAPLYDWIDYSIDLPELTFRRTVGLSAASDIFFSIGNTGTATHRRWVANTSTINLPAPHKTPRCIAEVDMDKNSDLVQLRHPNPALTTELELTAPELQVRGSWAKLPIKNARIAARYGFASFIWKSRMYIAGGLKSGLGPFYRDFWNLDLEKLDARKPLPDYPVPARHTGQFVNWTARVYENKAYIFTGHPRIDYFDLMIQQWDSVETTYTPIPEDKKAGVINDWPYVSSSGTQSLDAANYSGQAFCVWRRTQED